MSLLPLVELLIIHIDMPDTHPKSTPEKYTQQNLAEALSAVENGKSLRSTAKEFGIPYSTLWKKCRGNIYNIILLL